MDGYLTSEQVAQRLGIRPGSVHRYRNRGDIPPPDEQAGRTPLWAADTIERWLATRPGRGWRKGGRKQTPPPAEPDNRTTKP